jgi:hypothetical protein
MMMNTRQRPSGWVHQLGLVDLKYLNFVDNVFINLISLSSLNVASLEGGGG